MKKAAIIFVSLIFLVPIKGQTPQGFNYQAIARDVQGDLLINQSLTIQVNIYKNEGLVWSEDHEVITSEHGYFSLLIGDENVSGSGLAGTFREIDWGTGEFALGLKLNAGDGFTDLGMSPIQSVPYALYADSGPGVESQDLSISGSTLYLSNDPTPEGIPLDTVIRASSGWTRVADSVSTYNFVGIGTNVPNRTSLMVQGLNTATETPLFEVRRQDGVPVFAVFDDGVMVYVDESQKSAKGGFAVGGYNSSGKGVTQEYMRVTPDSVRIYVPETQTLKGAKGGFAVGGYNSSGKGIFQDLLYVAPDSIRMYVPDKENDPGFVGLQGGFAVETYGRDSIQTPREYIMGMNRGITRFNTADDSQGFAIGSQGGEWGSTYMQVTPINTFVGFESGKNTQTADITWNINQGANNVFLGYRAGQGNIFGSHNVFLGYQAGFSIAGDSLDNFDGSYNTIIGPFSGLWLDNGTSNIFLGKNAGGNAKVSNGNIFIGEGAGRYSKITSDNIVLGNHAGDQLGGNNNVLIGSGSGISNFEGNSNVFVGSNAGGNNYGSKNVFIGDSAGFNGVGDNQLFIDNANTTLPLIYGNFAEDFLRFNGSVGIFANPGSSLLTVREDRESHGFPAIAVYNNESTTGVGIGATGFGGGTGVSGYATVAGTGIRYGLYGYAANGETNYGLFAYATGGVSYAVYASGNLAYTGSLIAASDQKFKEHVEAVQPVMQSLMKLKPRNYQVIGSEETKQFGLEAKSQYGFIAQELELVFPELVVDVVQPRNPGLPDQEDEIQNEMETYKGVKYMEMIPILLKGIQEQQEEIELLKQRIAELEGVQ